MTPDLRALLLSTCRTLAPAVRREIIDYRTDPLRVALIDLVTTDEHGPTRLLAAEMLGCRRIGCHGLLADRIDRVLDALTAVEDCPRVLDEGAHDWEGACTWLIECDLCAAWHLEKLDDALAELLLVLGAVDDSPVLADLRAA